MARLLDGSLDEVWAEIMRTFSSVRSLIPISKTQLRALLGLIDEELEGAETSIVQALPAGVGKSWLIANPSIGRSLMMEVLEKRKEIMFGIKRMMI